MNCMVWLLDRLGLPRRFGIGNFAATRAVLAQSWASLSEIKFVMPRLDLQRYRPKEGQAPGEAWLDLLRSALKTVGPLAGVFAVTCGVIFGVHRFTDLNTARAEIQVQREILAQAMPQAVVGAETPTTPPARCPSPPATGRRAICWATAWRCRARASAALSP